MHNETHEWERPDRPTLTWAAAITAAVAIHAAIIAAINAGTHGLFLDWLTGGAL